MQRLLTRREIRVGSRMLVAVHPTRGLDVGATDEVRKVLLDQRMKGVAISTDFRRPGRARKNLRPSCCYVWRPYCW